MSAHISDDLPLLLTGDASRDVVLAAAGHLRSCADCQQELVSAVVAHASLMSAQRFAPEMLTLDGAGEHIAETRDAPVLPDLSAVFAQAREEAAVKPARRRRGALLAVAAAIVLLVGGGFAVADLNSGTSPASRTVALNEYQHGKAPAKITITGNRTLRLDAHQLPKLAAGQLYELWLTDSGRHNMQSVGLVGADNNAVLTVRPDLLAKFTAFEVSVQTTGENLYSGYSVLRGSYN